MFLCVGKKEKRRNLFAPFSPIRLAIRDAKSVASA
jgi:hypothetical protein